MKLDIHLDKLDDMAKYPTNLGYIGELKLLEKQAVSIVGTRKPTQYTKDITAKIALQLQKANIAVISGAAMGVDAIAHEYAGIDNTIAVVANGLDIRYPSVNRYLIEKIEQNGLVMSNYDMGQKATSYSFVHRNEIVVALGDVLVITQADKNSGSIRSAEFAKKMGKKIFVPPHRYGESPGTAELVKQGIAQTIHDIEEFLSHLGYNTTKQDTDDEVLIYCQQTGDYEKCVKKFGDKIFEYELIGKIKISNSKITVL